MENGGNAKVNAIFEARLPGPGIKPTNHANGPTRERFIRDKYERRKYYDPAGFANYAAQRPPAPPAETASSRKAAAVGPPSDAARQRLEQRRNRIGHAQSNVGEEPTSMSSSSRKARSKPEIAPAPVSAPPPSMDLLDLMGTSDGGGTSAPAPVDDLFASFVVAEKPSESAPTTAAVGTAAPLDIMSLYNNSGGAHPHTPQMMPQNNSFAAFDTLGSNSNSSVPNNGGGSRMPPQQPNNGMYHNGNNNNNNNMQQVTNMMSNMQFAAHQQQQQQHPNMMMYPQAGGGSGGYSQQQMMMMMQQQQQMMHMQQQQQQRMMMMQQQNGFGGGMMGGGGSPSMGLMPQSQPQPKVAKTPEKEDPFAQFGANVFRS